MECAGSRRVYRERRCTAQVPSPTTMTYAATMMTIVVTCCSYWARARRTLRARTYAMPSKARVRLIAVMAVILLSMCCTSRRIGSKKLPATSLKGRPQ